MQFQAQSKRVQKAEKIDALCTIFDLKRVQKAEKIDALCTKFGLNHALQRVKSVICIIYKCLGN